MDKLKEPPWVASPKALALGETERKLGKSLQLPPLLEAVVRLLLPIWGSLQWYCLEIAATTTMGLQTVIGSWEVAAVGNSWLMVNDFSSVSESETIFRGFLISGPKASRLEGWVKWWLNAFCMCVGANSLRCSYWLELFENANGPRISKMTSTNAYDT